MEALSINSHSSIQIGNIFFDPFQIEQQNPIAKCIFITHTHFDHLSIDDIKKVLNKNTIIIAPHDAKETLETNFDNKIILVEPNEIFEVDKIKVETYASYNTNKQFHPKANNWVGYKITIDETSYAVVGDTDATPELENLYVDVLFLPIGGTYTMTAAEASELANKIKPRLVIPTHYNSIVGSKEDEKIFVSGLNSVDYKILIKWKKIGKPIFLY